jgi:hypothetical protein
MPSAHSTAWLLLRHIAPFMPLHHLAQRPNMASSHSRGDQGGSHLSKGADGLAESPDAAGTAQPAGKSMLSHLSPSDGRPLSPARATRQEASGERPELWSALSIASRILMHDDPQAPPGGTRPVSLGPQSVSHVFLLFPVRQPEFVCDRSPSAASRLSSFCQEESGRGVVWSEVIRTLLISLQRQQKLGRAR